MILLAAEDLELEATLFALLYFGILFFWTSRWFFRQFRTLIQLKKEKAKTELIHLQSQVNPHFFFNTLNNLYGLVGKDTQKAQQLILKLSDMMRYSIYEGQEQFVSLNQEIDYLQNYMELHKMRYHKNVDIEFVTDIDSEHYKVTPLLFIILLENAFKHGVEDLRENAYVRLKLKGLDEIIEFTTENNFDKSARSNTAGIGLKNLRRRLELVYPNKHTLNFNETEDTYSAKLILQTS